MQVVNRKDNIQTFTPKIIIMGGTKLGPQKTHRAQKKRDRTQPNPPIRGTRLREKRAINMIKKNVHIIIIKCYRAQTKNPRREGKKRRRGYTQSVIERETVNTLKLFSLLDLCGGIYKRQYPVSDGDTPRKNVVLISMEIGAMALKTALFFVDSHHDAGYNVGLTDQW